MSDVTACRLIKRRNIHQAEELFSHAQVRNEAGDERLLAYCTGTEGMKKNLQQIVDAAWRSLGNEHELSEHSAQLTLSRLQELQELARSSSETRSTSSSIAVKRRMGDDVGVAQTVENGHAVLFDQYGLRGEIVFRPKGSIWRLRDLYEMLVACQREEALLGATPSTASEGGITIPRSETGWHSMLRAGIASPRMPFCELEKVDRVKAAGEFRFDICCGSMPWKPPPLVPQECWTEEMPKDPNFESNSFGNNVAEDCLVRLWAFNHVEDRQVMALMNVIASCAHTVEQTIGFTYCNERLEISSTKNRSSRHKALVGIKSVCYDVMNAPLCIAQMDARCQQSLTH